MDYKTSLVLTVFTKNQASPPVLMDRSKGIVSMIISQL
jgi:hypothetical protein